MDAFLTRHRLIALDTSAFIYFVERHPRYFGACEKVFRVIESGHIAACTSTLTLLEILVGPYQSRNEELALKFFSLLSTYPHLTWTPLTMDIADRAAKIRAELRLRTPDSIQAASAVASGATGFICNDAAFRRVENLECCVLDDHAL